ncbi:MAG TPA: dienelactone hydrolase family protein [Candidatus Eisenbacteria bacterium]|nr:dienelactone hydrolase family protein [Candidatus Eisenbacteria bacterium]
MVQGTVVSIPVGGAHLAGDLSIPAQAEGVVLFAHGSGSSRRSPRNRFVAGRLQDAGLATLLMDLLTPAEEVLDEESAGRLRFDIRFLARRLEAASSWLARGSGTAGLRLGYFGASTGAAAALVAAAEWTGEVGAIVSRGGRPDLAGRALGAVRAPTLLVVGGDDDAVIPLNRQALDRLRCEKRLEIVPGATHLFEEPGTLERVAELAAGWFSRHLGARGAGSGR